MSVRKQSTGSCDGDEWGRRHTERQRVGSLTNMTAPRHFYGSIKVPWHLQNVRLKPTTPAIATNIQDTYSACMTLGSKGGTQQGMPVTGMPLAGSRCSQVATVRSRGSNPSSSSSPSPSFATGLPSPAPHTGSEGREQAGKEESEARWRKCVRRPPFHPSPSPSQPYLALWETPCSSEAYG